MFGIKTRIKKIIKSMYSKLYAIEQEFLKVNPIFDTRYLDKKIEGYALSVVSQPTHSAPINKNHIALFATEIYDMGGSTELLKNLSQVLSKEYKIKLFLTKKTKSEQNTVKKMPEIKKYMIIGGIDFYCKNEKVLLSQFLRQLQEFSPSILITFLHPEDTVATAILALVKRHTHTKVIFCNVASQYSVLGMSFADLIWEGMPSTAFVTQRYRGFKNTKSLGLCYLTKDRLPTFNEQDIAMAKKEIGIPENALCTMSGCNSYKLFENGKSPYLKMIKKLLEENECLWHVLIAEFYGEQKKILDEMDMPNRFILTDSKPNFKLYFKCADVFIDSFPMSSALTMVDLMSLKVPFVAFKNKENLVLSFHEYFSENYDYLFDNTSDMQTGIEKLLYNKDEQKRITNKNFEHFLEYFEGSRVAQKILTTNSFDPEFSGEKYKDFRAIKLLPRRV